LNSIINASVTNGITAPYRQGFTFGGWTTEQGKAGVYTAANVGNAPAGTTLYAIWLDPSLVNYSFTVSFDKQGGTGTATNKTVTYGYGYGSLPAVTKDGYTFSGWRTAANGGTEVVSDTLVLLTQNQTLYAKWTPVAYLITYNNLLGATNTNPASYDVETPTITLSAPGARTGYAFGGWYAGAEYAGAVVTSIPTGGAGNVALYAKWTASLIYGGNLYAVEGYNVTLATYNGNAASFTVPVSFIVDGTAYTVTAIGANAFSGCSSLSSVTVPCGVQTIGDFAFPVTAKVTWIGKYEFEGGIFLSYLGGQASFTIPSVIAGRTITTVGGGTYGAPVFPNPATTSVTIPDTVVTIGAYAFYGSTLESLEIPSSVTSIGWGEFSYCTSLSITWRYNPAISIESFGILPTTIIMPDGGVTTGELIGGGELSIFDDARLDVSGHFVENMLYVIRLDHDVEGFTEYVFFDLNNYISYIAVTLPETGVYFSLIITWECEWDSVNNEWISVLSLILQNYGATEWESAQVSIYQFDFS
jgi:uncharacterized repeat protein (TIGR02543 family)